MSPTKLCFVTVGATASFSALLRDVLSDAFLNALRNHNYTHLRIQWGKDGAAAIGDGLSGDGDGSDVGLPEGKWLDVQGIKVSGFDFRAEGLGGEMKAAKEGILDGPGGEEKGVGGVVLSHAGSGSILEALRVDAPLIVVPNESLLDNHQVELAEELARQGFVVYGRLGALAEALEEVEGLRERKREWPPRDDVGRLATGRKPGLAGVMDDEMGFVD